MNNFNVNLAAQNIKSLVDFCRCVNCDEVDAKRLRYICGHSICEKCVPVIDTCMICSPPFNTNPSIDKPQSKRIRHTLELLKSFQNLFNVDVYRQLRISEQLKVEKELFPDCIQAPLKYFNKRKSSVIEKENIKPLSLPGENISNSPIKNKMENSINYVQQWLDKNKQSAKPKKIPRTPFADLEINTPNRDNILSSKPNSTKRSIDGNYDITWKSKRLKKNFSTSLKKRVEKCEQHESGIEIDTETIILDESQSDIIDKDKLALMAVENAEKTEHNFIHDNLFLNETLNKDKSKAFCQSTSVHKVPFYKKSYLVENCKLCVSELINYNNIKRNHSSMKNVTLTIDNKSFVTTIKLSEISPNKNVTKRSIAIQSDDIVLCSDNKKSKLDLQEAISEKCDSENIIKDCIDQENTETKGIKSKCIIFEDSDVDSSDADCNGKELEIEAEVHRSSDVIDYVLAPLETPEYINRQRTIVRGKTPASSDSSDKENFDPNKRKRLKYNKKIKNKKTRKI